MKLVFISTKFFRPLLKSTEGRRRERRHSVQASRGGGGGGEGPAMAGHKNKKKEKKGKRRIQRNVAPVATKKIETDPACTLLSIVHRFGLAYVG